MNLSPVRSHREAGLLGDLGITLYRSVGYIPMILHPLTMFEGIKKHGEMVSSDYFTWIIHQIGMTLFPLTSFQMSKHTTV